MLSAVVGGPPQTVWVRKPGAPLETHPSFFGSVIQRDGTCQNFQMTGTFVEAIELVNLLDHFTPPFSVRYLGTPVQ